MLSRIQNRIPKSASLAFLLFSCGLDPAPIKPTPQADTCQAPACYPDPKPPAHL